MWGVNEAQQGSRGVQKRKDITITGAGRWEGADAWHAGAAHANKTAAIAAVRYPSRHTVLVCVLVLRPGALPAANRPRRRNETRSASLQACYVKLDILLLTMHA